MSPLDQNPRDTADKADINCLLKFLCFRAGTDKVDEQCQYNKRLTLGYNNARYAYNKVIVHAHMTSHELPRSHCVR